MLYKVLIGCLTLISVATAQTCDIIVDSCVMGLCPDAAQTCISGICCLTAPATTTMPPTTTPAVTTQMPTTTPMITTVMPTTTTTSTPCFDKVGANGVSDCQRLAYLCNNANYYNLMTEQCPKTCGRCSAVQQATGAFTTQMPTTAMATTSSPCFDKVGANGVSDCLRLAYLCNNANYYKLMTEQCPKTCGRCSSASAGAGATAAPSNSCVDKTKADGTSDCSKDAYLCNNPKYYNFMTQECPKTCGRC